MGRKGLCASAVPASRADRLAGVPEAVGLGVTEGARALRGSRVAVRMLLVRVAAEKALPFEAKVPNAKTEAAFRASV